MSKDMAPDEAFKHVVLSIDHGSKDETAIVLAGRDENGQIILYDAAGNLAEEMYNRAIRLTDEPYGLNYASATCLAAASSMFLTSGNEPQCMPHYTDTRLSNLPHFTSPKPLTKRQKRRLKKG